MRGGSLTLTRPFEKHIIASVFQLWIQRQSAAKNEEAFPNALNCATIKQQNFAEVMGCGNKAI